MTFKDWLVDVKDKGLICERYLPLVDAARSRKQYMDIVLDVNGISFLCDMVDAGHGLSYDVMMGEFSPYINGRYIHVSTEGRRSYSASLYCGVRTPSEITASTTVLGVFNCNCIIHIPKNHIVRVCVDSKSDVVVDLEPDSQCYVYLWRGGKVSKCGDTVGAVIRDMKYGD